MAIPLLEKSPKINEIILRKSLLSHLSTKKRLQGLLMYINQHNFTNLCSKDKKILINDKAKLQIELFCRVLEISIPEITSI